MKHLMGKMTSGPGFDAFLHPDLYLQYIIILMAATLSGIVLAYHPVYRGRPRNFESIELSKTLIIYAVVGALIAIVCSANPSMAFVIFGIGGLMRFRTELKASKSTGHAIMGTLVGLCWGLGLQMVAVLATAYFWGMIFFLERTEVIELRVGGLEIESMTDSTEAYRKALSTAGCRILSTSKNFKKREMNYIFTLPRKVSMEKVDVAIGKIEKNLRGTPDLPE